MSLFTRAASTARHRGKTPMQLRTELDRLTAEADAYACELITLASEIDGLKAERRELAEALDAAGIELGAEQQETQRLRAELANLNAVTVPPMERDTTASEDQATEPTGIDVRTLRDAADAGLLGPIIRISDDGASADPATIPIPVVREPAA